MIFAVFDPSPLTLCINCSFFTFITLIIATCGKYVLTKGRIAILSPLSAANGFIRPWPHLTHVSLDPHESASQTASRSVQPFLQGSPVYPTHTQSDTDHATVHATSGTMQCTCSTLVLQVSQLPLTDTRDAEAQRMLNIPYRYCIIW